MFIFLHPVFFSSSQAKKGLFMMSWDSKLEFERSQEQQQGQEQQVHRALFICHVLFITIKCTLNDLFVLVLPVQQAPASEASAAATAPPAAAGVDLSNISSKDSKEKVLAWEHPGDEKQTLKSTLTYVRSVCAHSIDCHS